jgi:succinyl-diaminopimelate desuccinylase
VTTTDASAGGGEFVAIDTQDVFALTAALVDIPSVSLQETAIADAICARLAQRAPELAITRIGDNIIARSMTGAVTRVLFAGHLDTVPANNNATARIEGDVVHGVGSADMKSGLAVMLRLADELSARIAHGDYVSVDVTLVFYVAEEIADEHNGLRALFATAPELVVGDVAVLLEPTDGWIEAGCQGTLTIEAVVSGKRAHTARPWMGENAIHRASAMVARIAAADVTPVEIDGLTYRPAFQVVRIDGGVANNVVPDQCVVTINHRCAPNTSLDVALAQLRALCSEADACTVRNASPPAAPHLDALRSVIDALAVPVRAKLGWTDVARFAELGVPALNFGPGDPELAHRADEHVTRAAIEQCYEACVRLLRWTAR